MAPSKIFIFVAIVAVFVPSIWATEFLVGDDNGWTNNFDYQAWAQGKEFHVGDKLVFRYSEGAHSVLRVDGTGFLECTAPAETEALTTGNDVITLTSPGKKWYICGVAQHCESGNQKLAITVLPQAGSPAVSPPPSQNPSSAATGSIAPSYCVYGGMVAMVGFLEMVML